MKAVKIAEKNHKVWFVQKFICVIGCFEENRLAQNRFKIVIKLLWLLWLLWLYGYIKNRKLCPAGKQIMSLFWLCLLGGNELELKLCEALFCVFWPAFRCCTLQMLVKICFIMFFMQKVRKVIRSKKFEADVSFI